MDHNEKSLDQPAIALDEARRALLEAVCAIEEPLERARLTAPLVARFDIRDELAAARRAAIAEARDAGATWTEIGKALGISAARAQQIVTGRRR